MFGSRATVAAAIFCFTVTTTASFSNDHSQPAPRPQTPQFQSWYSNHAKALVEYTLTTCNESYTDYLIAFNSPLGSRNASYLLSTCHRVESCLLDTVPSNWQANFNSANVVLGLMPTLLASIGPSLSEISLLTAHRPLLSFLISLGAPTIWPNRIFEYVHPTEILRERRGPLGTSKSRPWLAAIISLGQYVVAIIAIANVITTSIGVGRKSILAFGCTSTFPPLLWSTLPSAIYLISAVSYVIERKMARRVPVKPLPKEGESAETAGDSEQLRSERNQATTSSMPQQRLHSSWLSRLRDAWLSETTICANRSKPHHLQDKAAVPRVAVLLTITAGLMGLVHVSLGVIIFSALQFISVSDAVTRIIWRYILSSMACRLLLNMEISGLRTDAEAGGP